MADCFVDAVKEMHKKIKALNSPARVPAAPNMTIQTIKTIKQYPRLLNTRTGK